MRYAVYLYGTQADYSTSTVFNIKNRALNFALQGTREASQNAPGYNYWATVVDTKLGTVINIMNGSEV